MLFPDAAHIQLHLTPTHTDTIPGWQGRTLQAIYLKAMQQISPEVSLAIHDYQGYHPYTVSDLLPMATQELREVHRGDKLRVILTTLHREVTQLTLNSVLPRWIECGMDVHGQQMRVVNADVRTSSFQALLAEQRESRQRMIALTFVTPTAVKKSRRPTAEGERRESHVVPLPMPERIFGSLLDRWNCFAPEPMPEGVRAFIEDEISIHSAQIRTCYVSRERANKGSTVGFMGDVVFQCTSSAPPWLGCVQALAAFAPFSGVGIKTTQGMGAVFLGRYTRKDRS